MKKSKSDRTYDEKTEGGAAWRNFRAEPSPVKLGRRNRFNFVSLLPRKVSKTKMSRISKVSESGPSFGARSERNRFFHSF